MLEWLPKSPRDCSGYQFYLLCQDSEKQFFPRCTDTHTQNYSKSKICTEINPSQNTGTGGGCRGSVGLPDNPGSLQCLRCSEAPSELFKKPFFIMFYIFETPMLINTAVLTLQNGISLSSKKTQLKLNGTAPPPQVQDPMLLPWLHCSQAGPVGASIFLSLNCNPI